MSFNVDPKTLLFVDLTEGEARDLATFVTDLVLNGHTNMQHPAFKSWYEAHGLRPGQDILVYSTSFPQRALLSIVRYQLGKG